MDRGDALDQFAKDFRVSVAYAGHRTDATWATLDEICFATRKIPCSLATRAVKGTSSMDSIAILISGSAGRV